MPPPLPWYPPGVFRRTEYAVSLAPERAHARLEIEAELNGVGNGWTDLTPDLRTEPTQETSYGITSTGPLALTASTGHMNFTLANGETNSAGLVGYYTLGHANCRSGWRIGIRVRWRYQLPGSATVYYKFQGWLDEVSPTAGRHRERKVECVALDYMNELAEANPIIAIQSSKRPDQILAVLQGALVRQPYSTNYDTGASTFLYALDSLDNESGSALSEMQRIAVSEGNGHIYVKGNTTGGGEFRFENRSRRFSWTSVATFNETMHGLTITEGRNQIRNKVKTTTHPRRVGTVTTDVLFSDQGKPLIASGATQVLSGDYTDPSNRAERIGGADMTTPVSGTDYVANTAADGSGTNLTANFVVTANYGGNSLEHTITNQSGSAGYLTTRQARGRTIKDLDPVDTVITDSASIALYGETRFYYDMPYQDDVGVASTIGSYTLARYAQPAPSEVTVTYRALDDARLAIALPIEVGDPITLVEPVAGINGDYFVQQVTMRCITDDAIEFEWLCERATALPFVQSRTTSAVTTNETSHTVNMPSGIQSGDLLLVVFTVDDTGPGPGTALPVFPAGWTKFAEQHDTISPEALTIAMAYRLADGTEGSTITVTTSVAQESTAATFRITGAENPSIQPPEATFGFTNLATTDVRLPSLTPTGGVKNYLWFGVGGISIQGGASVGYTLPSGYGNSQFQLANLDGWSTLTCERLNRTATETPGSITLASARRWMSALIAVPPKTS